MLTAVAAIIGVLVAFELANAAYRLGGSTRARALARRSRRSLPLGLGSLLARALVEAEVRITPEDAIRLWLAGIAGAGVVGASLAPALGILGALAIVVGPPIALRLASGRHAAALVAALPELVDQVATDLRSGGTVSGALDRVADGPGRLAPDLTTLRSRTGLGLDLVDALSRWATERPHPGFAEVAGALAIAATTGGRAAMALTGLAASLRDRLTCTDDARALSAQARASAVVVGTAPVAYLVFAAVIDPGSISVLVGTAVGRVCLVAGLALDAAAGLWMRRLLEGTS